VLAGSAYERAYAIAERCGGGREVRERWRVRCPAHDDHDPSLDITSKGDKVLLCCRSQHCTAEQIMHAIGLTLRDLFASDTEPQERPGWAAYKKKQREVAPARPAPAVPTGAAPTALEMALHFILDDVTYLEMPALQDVLRHAAAHPLQWLWLEQQLHQHGLSPRIVWQVLYPQAEEAFPEPPAPPQPTYRERLARRMRRSA